MFLGGDSDEGEMVCGVQVPHQAPGPLYQLGNLRRVLRTKKVNLVLHKYYTYRSQVRLPVMSTAPMLCYDTL
jgi:hypothetical protein